MSELKKLIESSSTQPMNWDTVPEIVKSAIQMEMFLDLCNPNK